MELECKGLFPQVYYRHEDPQLLHMYTYMKVGVKLSIEDWSIRWSKHYRKLRDCSSKLSIIVFVGASHIGYGCESAVV